MEPGVKCYKVDEASKKDDLWFHGDDVDAVSKTCKFLDFPHLPGAMIQQSCQMNKMDIRMFLDGVYVADKNATLPESASTKTALAS